MAAFFECFESHYVEFDRANVSRELAHFSTQGPIALFEHLFESFLLLP